MKKALSLPRLARDPESYGLGLCGAMLLAVAYVIADDSILFSRAKPSTGEVIGTVESFVNDVKSRPAVTPVWDEVEGKQELRQRDHLFTAGASRVGLVLKDGTRLDVEEQSLVVVELEPRGSLLDIRKGLVYIVPGRSDVDVAFLVNGVRGSVAAGESEAIVSVGADGTADVTVLKGSAKIGEGAESRTIGGRETGTVSREGRLGEVKRLAVSLGLPAWNAEVDVGAGGAAEFSWELGEPLRDARIELARDSMFTDVVRSQAVSGSSASVAAPPTGPLYWRVRGTKAQSGEAVVSDVRKVSIIRYVPPELRAPREGEVFVHGRPGGSGAGAVFDWQSASGSRSATLEIASDAAFATVVHRADAARPPLAVKLADGAYYARIRGVYAAGASSPWGEAVTFSVAPLPPLSAPMAEAPEDGRQVRFAGKETVPVAFAFRSPGAPLKRLVVEISDRPDFETLVDTVSSIRAAASWTPSAAGAYYWRSRLEDPLGRTSGYSEPRKLAVLAAVVLPPSLEAPADAALMPASGAPQRRTFRWTSQSAGARVRLEIARDAAFRDTVLSRDTEDTSFVWDAPEPGSFHWRIVEGPDGETPVPSAPRRVEVIEKPRLRAPVLTPKSDVIIEPDNQGGFRWHHVLFPVAYAAGSGVRAEIVWPVVENAVSYRLQIARDAEFAQVIVDDVTKVAAYVWRSPEPGLFFYRVLALDEDGDPSEFSAPAELVVRHRQLVTLSPADGAMVEGVEDKVSFQWQAHPAGASYVLEIASDPNFAELVDRQETRETSIAVELERSGTLHWRVRALTSTGAVAAESISRAINVAAAPEIQETPLPPVPEVPEVPEVPVVPPAAPTAEAAPPPLAAPRLKLPPDGAKLLMTGATDKLKLSWEAVPGATRYAVTLKPTAGAWAAASELTSEEPGLELTLPSGDYVWRVKATAGRKREGPWSVERRFKAVAFAPPQAPAPPLKAPILTVADARTYDSSIAFGIGMSRVSYEFTSSRAVRTVDDSATQGAAFAGSVRAGSFLDFRLRASGYSLEVDGERHALLRTLVDIGVRWPLAAALVLVPYLGLGARDTLIFHRSAGETVTAAAVGVTGAGLTGLRLVFTAGIFSGELGGEAALVVDGGPLTRRSAREWSASAGAFARVVGGLSLGIGYDHSDRSLDGLKRRADGEEQAAALRERVGLVTGRLAYLF